MISSSGSRLHSEYSVCSALMGWTLCARRYGRRRGLRQAQVAHLPQLHQFRHRAHGLLDGSVRIDAMLVVQIDHVHAEPRERGVAGRTHVLGAPVDAPDLRSGLAHDPELGREDDAVAPSFQGLAHRNLVGVRAVRVGGIEKADSQIEREMYQRYGLILGRPAGRIEIRQPHAAETDLGDLQALASQYACFHDPLRKKPGCRSAPCPG